MAIKPRAVLVRHAMAKLRAARDRYSSLEFHTLGDALLRGPNLRGFYMDLYVEFHAVGDVVPLRQNLNVGLMMDIK